MSLGIRKHNLNFDILDTGNPRTLIFLDSSEYFEEPDRPLLEVTLPGYTKYFLLNVAARKVNTFNSNTIGLTETLNSHNLVNLPDGLWTLKFKVCPYDKVYVQKYHLRTVTLENNIQKIFDFVELSDCDIEKDEKYQSAIIDIFILLESAKGHALKGNVKKASDQYQKLNTLVTDLLNKLSGSC
jgi:hypothetical protein